MNAILLVGGFGTRLRPLTLTRPKGLMPVFNRPFLSTQLDLFRGTPIKNIILAAGRHNRPYEKAFRGLGTKGQRIHFAYESQPLGTGGAIRFAYEVLKSQGLQGNDPLVVFNGDVFYDIDIKDLVSFHRRKQSQATISLIKMQDPSRYGVVPFTPARRIKKFIEKPHSFRRPAWINGGAYVLDADWIERIPKGRPVSIEKESFPQSLQRRENLFAYLTKGYWNDIGTHQAYLQAHLDLASKKPVLGRGLRRGRKVVLSGMVSIGSRVTLGNGSQIKNSVILDGVSIGENAVIEGAIIGAGSRIGEYVHLSSGAVLGDKSIVPAYSKL